MTAAHTPGPLWIEGSVYEGYAACVVGRVDVPGSAVPETRTLAQFRRLPDAFLFAAAPELLKSCSDWISYLDCIAEGDGLHEEQLLNAMRDAIAKAIGAA